MRNVEAIPLNVLRRIRQVVVLSLHAYFSSRIEYVFVTGTSNISLPPQNTIWLVQQIHRTIISLHQSKETIIYPNYYEWINMYKYETQNNYKITTTCVCVYIHH